MSQTVKMTTFITHPDTGAVVRLLPGEQVPDWAVIANPLALEGQAADETAEGKTQEMLAAAQSSQPQQQPAQQQPAQQPAAAQPVPPPTSGAGATIEAWREYAAKVGVPVSADMTRDDIILAVSKAQG